jgi:hypothetical protein
LKCEQKPPKGSSGTVGSLLIFGIELLRSQIPGVDAFPVSAAELLIWLWRGRPHAEDAEERFDIS